MKRTLLALIAAGCINSTLSAQNAAFDFLRIDVSARAAALNGSFVSMKDDPNVIFYNPASIATMTLPRISVSYLNHLMDVNAGSLSYARNIEGIGFIGAGINYINYGTFDRIDEDMNVLGTFGAQELAFITGIAGHFDDDLLIGINAKYIYSSIAQYRSNALAVDLGFLYDIPSQNFTIGGSVLNLGKQLKTYNGLIEPLPLDVKFGITKKPEHLPVFINIDFHRLNENSVTFWDHFSRFTVGAEFLMSKYIRVRAGYYNKQRKEMKTGTSGGFAGISMGVGIYYQEYQFDYAFNSYGNIGGLHRVSLSISL